MQCSRKTRFITWLKMPTTISMLITFVLTLAVMLRNQYGFFEHHIGRISFQAQPFIDYSGIIPIMLFASLNGYIPAFVLSLIVFIFTSFQVGEFAFVVFVFMAGVMCTIQPTFNYWYRSKIKTMLTILYFTVLLGNGWGIVINLVRNEPMHPWIAFVHFLSALGPCALVGIFCYLFFNHAPEKIRNLFLSGVYYSKECERAIRLLATSKHSKLKRHLTLIIVMEAIALSIAAAIFADVMINQFIGVARYFHTDIIKFTIRDWISLDLKMVILLMNVSVPILFFANSHAQNSIANPIILMKQAMDDFTRDTVAEDSDSVLDIHLLPIKTGDEIEELHKSLKKTVRSISHYIEELQREKQLEDDLKVAQAANKAKSAFLSNMSHEIRTPINAIVGFAEMLLRESDNPTTRDYAHDILNSSKTLLSLINDILDFSKIEAGKLEIIPVQYELASTINDLVNMIQKRAEDKQLAFHVNVDKETPHLLCGDEVRLKQCILNILTNAVKYTHSGSVTFSVNFEKKDEHTIRLLVRVEDTGIGIKQEDMGNLFTAFERIEEKRNRTIEGTGLGMNIVQQLLTMMNSQLEVQSEYGKGSIFSFALEQKVVNWEPIGDFTEMYKKSMETVSAYRESFTAPEAKILVTDDTPLNLKVIIGLLKQTGVQIDTAESGQATLALVQKNKYDVILLDHRMPGMDGIETLAAMKKLTDTLNADTPVIALTANAVTGARDMYLEAGFNDYLSKPIESEKLEKKLIQYLPAEKVHKVEAVAESAEPKTDAFPPMEGVDIAVALRNCGSEDTLRDAFKDFYANIEPKSAQIADFAVQCDWKNYTVLVHALKSSAKLIGALELSEQAKHLEACGDKGDEAEINEKTPALLELYRSYAQKLLPVAPQQSDAPTEKMDEAQFAEALSALKEVVGAFDFSTADQIVQDVDGYIVPESHAEQWKAIKQAVANVDQAAVLGLLA
ncbi:MAG: response regulator [Treponema sp.]|nr:response regulator [Treponema sp.]